MQNLFKNIIHLSLLVLLSFITVACTMADNISSEKCMVLTLRYGDVMIKLRPDLAPHHVERMIELTNEKFYDGVVFHRVIKGFMAQTGDPTGTGSGGSGKKIRAEFSKESHVRGVVSMARAASVDSADSQFFIVLKDSRFLDGQYTVFGQVVKGMEFVDLIKKGNEDDNGKVSDPDKIISAKILDGGC
jgi:cyclophilin family peptidyl-prolyl cis-trans isomerase